MAMTETVLSNEVKIRGANAADVPQITRIYNEGIRDRLATLRDGGAHPAGTAGLA